MHILEGGEGARMQPDVLVAYDFTKCAEEALAWAANLCRALGGHLRLVHVVSPFPTVDALSPVVPPPPTTQDLAQLESALRDAAASHDVAADVEVVIGASVGEAIVAAATDHHCNLIALGTHGRGGVKRMMLGSVAEQVLRHAPCPVTAVRTP